MTTLTSSDGDKSSGTISLAAPSTPQAESVNFPLDARISNSIAENIHADSLLDADHDRDLPSNLSLQETQLVCIFSYIIRNMEMAFSIINFFFIKIDDTY